MQVQDVMTTQVEIVNPTMTIRDAARKMRDENIGALPVGENDRLIGMVTDRDIAVRGVAADRAGGATSVRDVMSEKIYYCFSDDDVKKAAREMAEHQVRRLAVLNRDKRLVGVVALADLGQTDAEAGKAALRGVSKPSQQPRH